jgi:hypothetical protein
LFRKYSQKKVHNLWLAIFPARNPLLPQFGAVRVVNSAPKPPKDVLADDTISTQNKAAQQRGRQENAKAIAPGNHDYPIHIKDNHITQDVDTLDITSDQLYINPTAGSSKDKTPKSASIISKQGPLVYSGFVTSDQLKLNLSSTPAQRPEGAQSAAALGTFIDGCIPLEDQGVMAEPPAMGPTGVDCASVLPQWKQKRNQREQTELKSSNKTSKVSNIIFVESQKGKTD